MTLEPPFRRARKVDARALAVLINEAGEGIPMVFWKKKAAEDGRDPLDVGAERAGREGENFSYQNVIVADLEGKVAAMLLAYPLPKAPEDVDLDRLPELLRPLVILEGKAPGTFYINAIAADPALRGLGLGTKLLDIAENLAREAGCTALSLIASAENTGAVRLYERSGFHTVERLPAVRHPDLHFDGDWLLMIRELD